MTELLNHQAADAMDEVAAVPAPMPRAGVAEPWSERAKYIPLRLTLEVSPSHKHDQPVSQTESLLILLAF